MVEIHDQLYMWLNSSKQQVGAPDRAQRRPTATRTDAAGMALAPNGVRFTF